MSANNKSLDAEIAIIGAGVAGLAAAKKLQALDKSFVLLEASHRFGGRAYTEQLEEDIPFDLGAHWIHSDKLNPFVDIAKRHGARLEDETEHYTAGAYFEDDHWLPESSASEFGEYFDAQFDALKRAAAAGDKRSVMDVIDNDSRWAPYFYLFFGQDYTCDVDMVSASDAAAYIKSGTDLAVANGFGSLVADWGSDVPVSLNCAVQEIDWSANPVKLTTSKGVMRVGKVILTVSTGVLATRQIRFTPELPEWKTTAIQSLPMGSCTRVGLTFDKPFLDGLAREFTIRVGDDQPLHFRNRPCGFPCVEIATGGRLAEWMEKSGEEATIEFIIGTLRHALGNNANMRPRRKIVSAWTGDAWTKGSYSYAVPGAQQQRAQLAEAIDDRLYFAGEATSADYYSTVHGAYFSGRDVASLINQAD